MELRSQDKDGLGMPNSLDYNSAQHNTQESSSSKLSSASVIPNVVVVDRRRNEAGDQESTIINPTQTLDHPHLYPPHHLNQQQQQQQETLQRLPNPDPVLAASATIGTASNSLPLPLPPPSRPPPQLQPTTSAAPIQYRECLKNHAASMGGHVVDGCREFMPSGEEGTPEALKCAACDCHRNFHRKEVEGEAQSGANCFYTYNHNKNNSRKAVIHASQAPPPSLHHPPPPQLHHKYPTHGYSHGLSTSPPAGPVPQVMMAAFGGGGGAPAESSSEDLNMFQSNAGVQPVAPPSFSSSKKRYRTKFTQQQKDRMQEFAEKLGWKIQKQDEQEVQQFCTEMGVKRQVFKVWMHNNKQAMKKKQLLHNGLEHLQCEGQQMGMG